MPGGAYDTRTPRVLRIARASSFVAWFCVFGGGAIDAVAAARGSSQLGEASRSINFAMFYVVLILWMVLTAVGRPARRTPLYLMLAAVILFAAGSTVLNASAPPDLQKFPAPGEWFFLASYFLMAAYLVVGSIRGRRTPGAVWLEAMVICGGTACVAEMLLLSPLANGFEHRGASQLLAVLYPLIDLVLMVVVIGQAVLRIGGGRANTFSRAFGFFAFAIADISFVQGIQSGRYTFGLIDDIFWGVGLTLLVGSACRPSTEDGPPRPRKQGVLVMLGASLVAIVVLVVRPTDGVAAYVTIPAVLTLLAAGGRLALALRDANGAAEAIVLSLTDDLTMLPNRRAVLARLDEALSLPDQPVSLMMLDLDGFKEVNDTLGHAAGDTVLQFTAMRIRDAVPAEVLVGRLGGDEFALVIPDSDPLRLLDIGNVVTNTLSQPTLVDGIELTTNGSVGITMRTADDRNSTDLLRRADVAMYQSKLMRSGALLYDADQDDFSRGKLQLAEQLRRAILEGQLTLWYQPQIDAVTQQICGLEALVRWNHPQQGVLPPALFLPGARRAGLMSMLSDAVGRMAVADICAWRTRGLHVRVAVNCAPPELLSGIFLPRLFAAVQDANLPPDSLVIEITEDSFLSDPERTKKILSEIRQHDVQIAIDDYGTGFSSLSYLRDLPVQELKMDRSFVATLRSDPRNQMIVASTFQMARALGLRMVAEGVEDAATAADLIAMGVDVLQGYHLARPMPASEIEGWIRAWAPATLGDRGPISVEPGSL